jgi:hypothetical protein
MIRCGPVAIVLKMANSASCHLVDRRQQLASLAISIGSGGSAQATSFAPYEARWKYPYEFGMR